MNLLPCCNVDSAYENWPCWTSHYQLPVCVRACVRVPARTGVNQCLQVMVSEVPELEFMSDDWFQ
eukprot:2815986-Amphidinium_carterae.1